MNRYLCKCCAKSTSLAFRLLFLLLEVYVYVLNNHSAPQLLKAATWEKVINGSRGFSCVYMLYDPIKVDGLI
jgi:hypothetical protein